MKSSHIYSIYERFMPGVTRGRLICHAKQINSNLPLSRVTEGLVARVRLLLGGKGNCRQEEQKNEKNHR